MESAQLIASKFKIRASSCIDIMAEGKGGKISVGAMTYCKNWLKEYLYGRRKEIKSKYIDKGNSTEEDGFTLMATEIIGDMVYKNTERRSNDWCEGECDLFYNRVVYDNKSSWDLSTFPMFEIDIPDKKYWWQMQVYAWLWDADKAVLSYTLNDADREMVEQALKWVVNHDEAYKIVTGMVFTQEAFDAYKDEFFFTSELHEFVPIPDSDRVRQFPIEVDPEAREKIKRHVELCREYIISLLNK